MKFLKVDYYHYYCDRILKVRNRYLHSTNRIYRLYLRKKYNKFCFKSRTYLPLTAKLGKNIVFPHGLHDVWLSGQSVIGDNCVIFQHVTIASNTLKDSSKAGSPTIGNNCYIGTGAKIIGHINIGNNVRIGANATVTCDVPDNSTIVPAKSVIIRHDKPRDNEFVQIGKIAKKGE